MNRIRALFSFVLLALPALAGAQAAATTATAPTQDKEEVTFNEVERGLFLGVNGGPLFFVNPPGNGERPFSPGQMAQVEVGTDLGSLLSLSVFVTGSANRAGSNYVGYSTTGESGDFASLIPGLSLRANLVGLKDAQETQRTFFYVRGGAGYVFFFPRALLPKPDILVFAGPGVEYYTRLRHFSIGVEVSATYMLTSGSFGFSVTPNLRYAF